MKEIIGGGVKTPQLLNTTEEAHGLDEGNYWRWSENATASEHDRRSTWT